MQDCGTEQPRNEDVSLRDVRRGRLLFLILAALIFFDQVSSIVRAFAGDTEDFRLWRSVLLPIIVAIGVVALWQGETWLRRLMATWALLHGGVHLFVLGFLMYQMAAVTPPSETAFFLTMSAMLFGLPLLYAGFYLFVGLSLLLSRSLKTFFSDQAETGENPLAALTNWLVGFVARD